MTDKATDVDDQQAIVDQKPKDITPETVEARAAVKDYEKGSDNGQLSMKVLVYSPYKTYYQGVAFSLTAESATGTFDILPQHHSFISLLVPCEVVVRTVTSDERKIRISGGIIHVKADEVVIFLDV